MSFIHRIMRRLAPPEDRQALEGNPPWALKLRTLARIGWRYPGIYVTLLVLTLVLTVNLGVDIVHKTESPQFCGACHEMSANLQSWESSTHGHIQCVDCHARPGPSGFIEAKMGGMRQLVRHATEESFDNIELDAHATDVVNNNCQRCHPGAVRLEEREGLRFAHAQHAEMGVGCTSCHSGSFVHPSDDAGGPKRVADAANCQACHDGETKVGEHVAFDLGSEQSCSKCHPDAALASAHHASKPEYKRACLDCHKPSADAPHFRFDREQTSLMCAQCHDPVQAKASIHEPYAKGRCDSCHLVMSGSHLYGTGPTPSSTLCLSCHDDMGKALAAKDPHNLTAFADGDTDLHRVHAGELAEGGNNWCAACHSPHASDGARAMVVVRSLEDEDAEPGTFTAGAKRGGSCNGACHEDDEREYEGPTEAKPLAPALKEGAQ